MTSPILALRAAILNLTQADPELANLMGGAVRLHEEVPRAAEPVYAVFGDATARDWSTASDRGHEQDAAIIVAAEGSAKTALLAAERIAALLDGAAPALDGHRLVSLRVREIDVGRDGSTNLARVTLRLRALTEMI